MINRHRMCCLTLIAALCASVLGATPARAAEPKDALKLVPEDAWGFVLLRSLETIDERAAFLQQTLSLPIPPTVTPFAMMPLGITPGAENPLDMKSPVCIAVLDVQKFGAEDESNAAVVIAPAADPAALLKKFNAEEPTDGVCKCTIVGNPAFAAIRDKWVILGKSQDCVTRVLKSKKGMNESIASSRMKVLGQSDIYVSASVHAIMGAYKDVVSNYMQGMAAVMGPQGGQLKNIQKIMEEVGYFDLATTIGRDGISLQFLFDAKKDSDFDKLIRATKNSSDSLISVLPKDMFLLTMGNCGGYNEHAMKFSDANPISGMLAGIQGAEFDEKVAKDLDAEVQKIGKNTVGWAMSISALDGAATDGMFGFTAVIETKNSEEYMSSLRKCWEILWELSTGEEMKEAREFLTHKKDAESVGDRKVDVITLDVKGISEKHESDEDDIKTMENILGKDISVRFGATDSTHIVVTFGGGKARYETCCKAASAGKSGSLATDKGITAVSPSLPSPRSVEGYVAVDNIIQVAKKVMKVMGEEDEIPSTTTIDAPFAFSMQSEGGVMRGDLHVPTKLIVSIKKMMDDKAKSDAMSAFDEDEEDDSEGEEGSEDDSSEE